MGNIIVACFLLTHSTSVSQHSFQDNLGKPAPER